VHGREHVRRDGRRARFLAALLSALLIPTAFVAMATPAHAGDASTIVSLTNGERAERGLAKYRTSSDLTSIAQRWSEKMARSGKLAHNPSLASQVDGYRYVGENVGYGPSTSKIFSALMNSTAHKHNILDRDFTQIGVGAARDDNGRLWITQVFREPTGSSGGDSSSSSTSKKKTKKKTESTSTKPKKKAAPKPKKKASTTKPKPKATPSPTPTPERTVKAVSSSGNAKAPTAAKPVAAPVPTFADRLTEANRFAEAAGGNDPLASTMAFDRAMQSLAG
jgi:hypothetical protein